MFKDRLCVIIIVGTKNNSHRCFFDFLRKNNADTAFWRFFYVCEVGVSLVTDHAPALAQGLRMHGMRVSEV
jgi:hypothetical protein